MEEENKYERGTVVSQRLYIENLEADNKKLLIQMQDYARLKEAESDYALNYGLAAVFTLFGSMIASIENFMSLQLSAPCNHYVGGALVVAGVTIGYVRPAVSYVIRRIKNRKNNDGIS
jgi:hypothetical protein